MENSRTYLTKKGLEWFKDPFICKCKELINEFTKDKATEHEKYIEAVAMPVLHSDGALEYHINLFSKTAL